jgi:hypothetical protein
LSDYESRNLCDRNARHLRCRLGPVRQHPVWGTGPSQTSCNFFSQMNPGLLSVFSAAPTSGSSDHGDGLGGEGPSKRHRKSPTLQRQSKMGSWTRML